MERFDVAVIARGAGATAAYHLARARARVLIVDGRQGAVPTGQALRRWAHDAGRPAAALFRRASRGRQDHAHALPAAIRAQDRTQPSCVICMMTQRRRLAAFLVEQAVAAEAELRDWVRVSVDSETELHVGRNNLRAPSLR